MAAYMSELAFLANPVSSHVQAAKMNNQSVNSLALISARCTADAVELVGLMCAGHFYALLQALDLQALREVYIRSIRDGLLGIWIYRYFCSDETTYPNVVDKLMEAIENGLTQAKNQDLDRRAKSAVDASIATLLDLIQTNEDRVQLSAPLCVFADDIGCLVASFRTLVPDITVKAITSAQKRFWRPGPIPETEELLSSGSKGLY